MPRVQGQEEGFFQGGLISQLNENAKCMLSVVGCRLWDYGGCKIEVIL
jgi:hypothetical protein